MPKIKLNGGTKLAVIRLTIVGKIDIDDLSDFPLIEECLEKIREYGTAEISHTEIVEVCKK